MFIRYEYQRNEQPNIYPYSEKPLTKMFQKQNVLQEWLFKVHEEVITSIISSNTTITHQRLDQLKEKTDKNTKKLIDAETESKEITKIIDTFEDIINDDIRSKK